MLNRIDRNTTAWSFNFVYLQNVLKNHMFDINVKTATNHSSRKLSKLDEPDTRDSAGEVRENS